MSSLAPSPRSPVAPATEAPAEEPRPSGQQAIVHDPAYARRKAAKILAILRQVQGLRLAEATCVDVGCASGLITGALAAHMGRVVGVDLDGPSAAVAAAESQRPFTFVRGDAQQLPVASGVADVVICAQVYEHVADADALMAEIHRVLAPGGVCFFSGPNRLDPIERHYGLPFVSLLPRRLADAYIRLARRGPRYTEQPRTYWGLRRLVRHFSLQDYTLELIRHARAYDCVEEVGRLAWVGRLPEPLLRALRPLYPNYNWVLRKPGERPR